MSKAREEVKIYFQGNPIHSNKQCCDATGYSYHTVRSISKELRESGEIARISRVKEIAGCSPEELLLERWMEKLGVGIAELAILLNTSTTSLYSYKKGKRDSKNIDHMLFVLDFFDRSGLIDGYRRAVERKSKQKGE